MEFHTYYDRTMWWTRINALGNTTWSNLPVCFAVCHFLFPRKWAAPGRGVGALSLPFTRWVTNSLPYLSSMRGTLSTRRPPFSLCPWEWPCHLWLFLAFVAHGFIVSWLVVAFASTPLFSCLPLQCSVRCVRASWSRLGDRCG